MTDPAAVEAAYAAYEAAQARLAAPDYTRPGCADIVGVAVATGNVEVRRRGGRSPIPAAAQTQATAKDIGAKDWPEVLHVRLRISREEARRRVRDCDHLGPRSAITGEALAHRWNWWPPRWPRVRNAEHITVITWFFQKLPLWAADPITLTQCETDPAADARVKTPRRPS